MSVTSLVQTCWSLWGLSSRPRRALGHCPRRIPWARCSFCSSCCCSVPVPPVAFSLPLGSCRSHSTCCKVGWRRRSTSRWQRGDSLETQGKIIWSILLSTKTPPSKCRVSLDKDLSSVFSQRISIPAGITGFNHGNRIRALFLAPCLRSLCLHFPICKKTSMLISSAKPFQIFETCKRSSWWNIQLLILYDRLNIFHVLSGWL